MSHYATEVCKCPIKMEQGRNKTGTRMEQKWNKNGTRLEQGWNHDNPVIKPHPFDHNMPPKPVFKKGSSSIFVQTKWMVTILGLPRFS